MFKWFWRLIHKIYANPNIDFLHIPMAHLSRFDWHYFLYDNQGNVFDGTSNLFDAIKKSKELNCYFTRVWD